PPVMDDVAAMLAFTDKQEAAKPGPVGAHGYCMSGPYALAAAARYPERVTAAASFYGTWLVNDAEESPHLSLGKVKGELYIACAGTTNEAVTAILAVTGGAYGWMRVSVRLITKASWRSKKSATTSTKASGRSASSAWPAS